MRILLADDEERVRFALRKLLERQPNLDIVAEASDAQDVLRETAQSEPDLLLLDWELPGHVAAILLPALRQVHPQLQVIVLSGRPEARRVALAGGADAFVSKAEPPERLLSAITTCCGSTAGVQPGGNRDVLPQHPHA